MKNINKNLNMPDILLFYAVSFLIICSIVFSYSLSIYTAISHGYGQFHFFIRQLFVGVTGIILMWFLSKQNPYKIIDYIGIRLFIIFFILICIMPILPDVLVTESLGARRWIKFPILSISPVEFFKIGFAYFIARSFDKHLLGKDKYLTIKEELILYLPYILLLLVLIYFIAIKQKDFGQIFLMMLVIFILLIFSNRSSRVFIFSGFIVFFTVFLLIKISPHRLDRIQSWWGMIQDKVLVVLPESLASKYRLDNLPEPYQVSHSLNAIHNGGYFGTGIGEGSLKMGYLSEVHTDFILAGITEEVGLVGLCVIVFVLLFTIQRIIRISRRINNDKFHLFTLAIALLISFSFLINFGGITGLIPIKGMAVPFLSYGGSSMLSLCIAIGLVLSISQLVPKRNNKNNNIKGNQN
jgi:cell division protein FtsW